MGQHLLILRFCQLKNLLTSLAQNVHANEKGCGKYVVFEQKNAGSEEADMVLIEQSVEPFIISAFSAGSHHWWDDQANISSS